MANVMFHAGLVINGLFLILAAVEGEVTTIGFDDFIMSVARTCSLMKPYLLVGGISFAHIYSFGVISS